MATTPTEKRKEQGKKVQESQESTAQKKSVQTSEKNTAKTSQKKVAQNSEESATQKKVTQKRAKPSTPLVSQPVPNVRRRYWSREEDRILLEVIKTTEKRKSGRIHWEEVAKQVHGRNRKQCSKRYSVISNQSETTKLKWKPEEDRLLVKAFESTKKRADGHPNWVAIAKKIDGRNRNQCYKRYGLISNLSATKNLRWVPDEDRLLLKAFTSTDKLPFGRPDWISIAKHLPGRNGRQCCERYTNICGRSKTRNIRWSPDEDRKLLKAFEDTDKHADGCPDWVSIAEQLDGRTRKQCSKRYFVLNTTSKTRNMRWGTEEDRMLLKAVETTEKLDDGKPDWDTIAKKVSGRSRIQCFSRYQYKFNRLLSGPGPIVKEAQRAVPKLSKVGALPITSPVHHEV